MQQEHRFTNAEYSKIMQHMPIPCVDLVIRRRNEYLLVERNNPPAQGVYYLPGGAVMRGETAKQAALRQAERECGLTCSFVRVLGATEAIFPDSTFPGVGCHSWSLVCLLDLIRAQTPVLDYQGTAFRWLSRSLAINAKYAHALWFRFYPVHGAERNCIPLPEVWR